MVNFNPATVDILEGHWISEYHPAVPLFISERVFKPTKKSNTLKLSTIVDCSQFAKVKWIIQTCRFFSSVLLLTILELCSLLNHPDPFTIHSPTTPANETHVATGERLYFGNLAVGETMF